MATYKNIVCTDTAELCTIAGRTFTKDVSGFALCGYYYLTSGYTGPIVVSPTQSVAHYQPGNIGSNDYVEINGVKWYFTVDGYFQSGNRDASSGNYTLKIGSFSNARDCATYLVNLYYDLISTSVKPTGTGNVSVSYNNENAIVLANANSGYIFDYWLLDGYTRLDYIESSGTQYIDTGLAVSSGMTFKTECLFTTTDGRGTILAQSNSSRYAPWISREFLRPSVSYKTANIDLSINEWHNIEVNDTNAIVDETTYTYTNNTDIVSGGNVWLFRRADGNYYGKGRIKTLSIEQNGAFLRNFIPVIRHSDGAIGLLDLVHMCFYENKGTGTFIGGGVYAS